jgi:hypothetical protein
LFKFLTKEYVRYVGGDRGYVDRLNWGAAWWFDLTAFTVRGMGGKGVIVILYLFMIVFILV